MSAPRTLFGKVWDRHVVVPESAETPAVLYIDLHLVHEVTSPQAFAALRERGLPVRRPDRTLATVDHSIPDQRRQLERRAGRDGPRRALAADAHAGRQLRACRRAVVRRQQHAPRHRARDRPGAGRHATRHDHRLRRQPYHARTVPSARWPSASAPRKSATCWRRSACCSAGRRRCWSSWPGGCQPGVTAKDVILAVIGRIGVDGGTGHVIEFRGAAVRGACRWTSA